MVNYLNKYSLRLAELGDSLHELTKKNAHFLLGAEHTEAFDATNSCNNPPVLQFQPGHIYSKLNASLKGLRAVLL